MKIQSYLSLIRIMPKNFNNKNLIPFTTLNTLTNIKLKILNHKFFNSI